ncbi:PEGA domain-containing protein [Nitrospira tepida]|nr:PEGA domain-containing protein [Nitrospira tepida]
MRSMFRFGLPILSLWTLLSGCASLMHGDHQSVTLYTDPPEADILLDERVHVTAPGKVSLNRKEDHTARIEKAGYEPVTVRIERGMSNWVYADGICLIFIYWCVKSDRQDGGFWTFDDEVHVRLAQQRSVSQSSSPPAEQ